ncbi:MAG: sigma-54-dependent transcriptional regulator [Lautropia sp.]
MATETGGVRALARGLRVPRVLVVDDEENLRELLELTLVGMGLDVDTAPDIGSARRLLGEHRYALCLTDMRLPDGNGLELVALLSRAGAPGERGTGGEESAETPVAVITAYGSAENAVAALKAGAFDYLAKPVALDALRALVRSALNLSVGAQGAARAGADGPGQAAAGWRAEAGAGTARQPAAFGAVRAGDLGGAASEAAGVAGAPRAGGPRAAGSAAAGASRAHRRLIGNSPAMQVVRQSIARMARSMAPVAITGESGSGKELAARMIHHEGARANGPFVAVNCGAIPETLMESEFFGYRKGAFTGADMDRDGFFAAASGGTLFLDEVADLPLAMQVKLLRAIQEKRVRKVGAVTEESVDVRIISATHQDLAQCVLRGTFRQDLYYRLNVIELRMPALRERREDIVELAEALLVRLCAGAQTMPRLSGVTRSFLESYDFPGNVRELENILERALAFSDGQVVNVEDLGLKPTVLDDRERDAAARGAVDGQAANGDRADAGPAPTAGDPPDAVLDPDGIPHSLPDYLDGLERDAILRALVKTRQNRTAAARLLGITFRALRYRMQRLDIQ